MEIDPSLAASDAERVTQNVTAITLISNKNPERMKITQKTRMKWCYIIRDLIMNTLKIFKVFCHTIFHESTELKMFGTQVKDIDLAHQFPQEYSTHKVSDNENYQRRGKL